MTNFILDTDVIIDALRGEPKASEFIMKYDDLNISSYTVFELIAGCKDKKSLERVNRFLENFTIYYSNELSQKKSWKLFSQYKLSSGLGLIDCLIAGIAMREGYTLVTKNLKHFEFIDDLKVHKPY